MESNSLILTIITTIAVFISFLQECIAWSKCKPNSIGQVCHESLKGMKFIKNKSGFDVKLEYDEDIKLKNFKKKNKKIDLNQIV
jgi:hypothetical protein